MGSCGCGCRVQVPGGGARPRFAYGDAHSDTDIQAILEQIELFIVPIVNLARHVYSWTDDRFWRKNRRDHFPIPEFGVDLNRNWGVDWGGPESTSSDPGRA